MTFGIHLGPNATKALELQFQGFGNMGRQQPRVLFEDLCLQMSYVARPGVSVACSFQASLLFASDGLPQQGGGLGASTTMPNK